MKRHINKMKRQIPLFSIRIILDFKILFTVNLLFLSIFLQTDMSFAQSDSTITYYYTSNDSNCSILTAWIEHESSASMTSGRVGLGTTTDSAITFIHFSNFDTLIPQEAVIDSAFLCFHIVQEPSRNNELDTVKIFALKKDLDNYDFSWEYYDLSNSYPWGKPGAGEDGVDYTSDSCTTHYFSSSLSSLTLVSFNVTGLMRISFGRDSTLDYKGWIIKQTPFRYNSRHIFRNEDSAYPPSLKVYYSIPMDIPTNLSATDGDSANSVFLKWNDVSDADSFLVFTSDSAEGSYSFLTSTADTFLSDTSAPGFVVNPSTSISASNDSIRKIILNWSGASVIRGDTVWYKIRAVDTSESDTSEYTIAEPGFKNDTIDSTKAYIFKADSITGDYEFTFLDSSTTPLQYIHTDLNPGDSLWYKIKVVSNNGTWSLPSDSIMGITADHGSITINIKSSLDSTLIQDASITITPGDTTLQTDTTGYVIFGNLPEIYNYSFGATKEYFDSVAVSNIKISDMDTTIYLTPTAGILTGVIIDSISSAAINNAKVTISKAAYKDSSYTDKDGNFLLSNIPPDSSLILTISHPLYNTAIVSPCTVMIGSNDIDSVLLSPNSSSDVGIDIKLTSAGMERDLSFGYHPSGTDNIDSFLGELELPPKPIGGSVFDARFISDSLGNGSLTDIRNSTFDSHTFYIDLQRVNSSDSIVVEWDSISVIGAGFTMIEQIQGADGEVIDMRQYYSHTVDSSGVDKLKIIIGDAPVTNWTTNYATGWHLVSLGGLYGNNSLNSVFPTAADAWTYTGSGYSAPSILEAGTGYWVNFSSADNKSRTVESIDSLSLNVSEGWNMIGTLSGIVVISEDISFGGTITSIYGSNGSEYVKVTNDTLTQGNGYWINLSTGGTLSMYDGAGISKAAGVIFAADPQPEMSIPLTARSDHGMADIEIHLGNFRDAEILNRASQLPPLQPFRKLDARFVSENSSGSDNIYVPKDRPFETGIRINAADGSGRITLTWDKSKLEPGKYFLKDGMNGVFFYDVDMAETNELAFDAGSTEMLKFCYYSESIIAEEYSLHPNYPNPFNPTTTIKYSIKDAGKVKLSIYNILGQEVRSLVSEVKPAGTFTVRWDATDNRGIRVAGGVYFYRLEINGVSFTRKLVLIK